MKVIIDWCNQNQGFLSAILAAVSLGVSFLALCIAQKSDRKQYKQSLYENRLFIIKKIDELQEFITFLELYKKRLLEQHIESKKQAIDTIAPSEINMEWVYEFRKGKYVVGTEKRNDIINISNMVSTLLRNYRMLKESLKRNTMGTEHAEDVFKDIDKIKNAIDDLSASLEKELYL